jgi:carbon storage regulator
VVSLNKSNVKLRVVGSEIGGRLTSDKLYGPLTRDQGIIIAPDIRIDVVDLRQDPHAIKVRLGITAPKSFSVHRKEVYDAIRRENDRNGFNH